LCITEPADHVSWASLGLKATAQDIERTWITGHAIMPAFCRIAALDGSDDHALP